MTCIMKIKAKILEEIFSNNENDFFVYRCEHNNNIISVTTNGFELRPGIVTLVGEFRKYRGNISFKCDYEEFDSNSYESKLNILCSIKGIKEITANKIIDGINGGNLDVLCGKKMPKIKGIGKKTFDIISKGLEFLKENENLKALISLAGGIMSAKKIRQLNEKLIEDKISIDDFKKDPYYILIDDMEMSFKKADNFALNNLKCNTNLRSRILFLSEEIVKIITGFGDTYTVIDTFKEKLDSYNIRYNDINKLINCDDSKIINDNGRIQTKILYKSECEIPNLLQDLKNKNFISNYELSNVNSIIKQYEVENNIILHKSQKQAITDSMAYNVNIICGGAGTGKTTIIKAIIYCLEKLNYGVVCTAPTGKASRRMAESTSHESMTCHKFIFSEESNNTEKWTEKKYNTMIIDEFSMVDTVLFYDILNTMKNSITSFNRLILVGDPGQLPSVGAGNVMHDIIESNKINNIKLTNTFRQEKDSNILLSANKVRENNMFELIKEKDFFTMITQNLDSYILRCWIKKAELITDLDKLFNEFQICTSSNKRCKEINKIIQQEQKNTQIYINNKPSGFCLNDKIMNIKNDYINDVYNGEFGRLSAVIAKNIETQEVIRFEENDEIEKLNNFRNKFKNFEFEVYFKGLNKSIIYDLSYDDLNNFTLSYACTIHKLQGSEFETVLCDVSEFNMITDSRLLYTAITRAKQLFILLSSSKDTIEKIVGNKISSKRKTLLLERFNNIAEKSENTDDIEVI